LSGLVGSEDEEKAESPRRRIPRRIWGLYSSRTASVVEHEAYNKLISLFKDDL
jgi:hypothetical protein